MLNPLRMMVFQCLYFTVFSLRPICSAKLVHTLARSRSLSIQNIGRLSSSCVDAVTVDAQLLATNLDAIDCDYSNGKVPRGKIRQHVNPLSSKYQQPIVLKNDWMHEAYEHPLGRSYIIDIGCSRGTWAMYSQV